MKLNDLLHGIIECHKLPCVEIELLTDNSKKACANALFVCVCGARFDGHDYAQQAYRNGCRVFVAQKRIDLPQDALIFTVADTRRTLSLLACRFFGDPSRKMRLIGITGTKGKTTTAQLIAHLFNTSNIPCGYIGTNGIDYADCHRDTLNTTPDPLTLQGALSDMLRHGVKTAVLEVSSQALAQYRADGAVFETLLFTNLALDHVGRGEHLDFDHYKACKKRLFTEFPAKRVIYWADDPHANEIVTPPPPTPLIACSQALDSADYRLQNVTAIQNNSGFGVGYDLCQGGKIVSGYLPLLGKINAQNATLALAAVTEMSGLSLEAAVKSLKNALVAGRSEQKRLPSGACVCIDYAHNAFSLRQLLLSLREYTKGRLIVLFGSVGERTQLRRREMGEVAAACGDLAILTSDNPGNEPPEDIIADIASGFEGSKTPYESIPDRKTAILYALGLLKRGDILVLAGKGHENYQLIGREKLPFCESEIVEAYIASQNQRDIASAPI
ncbi:MAG: UDP-N-acetylmuramoyl-L-alanyl-D-glutamate--2,6-diaminopimelate ligase [Clostridia bacterium]|nr:UDP-N-acetylmuramoyl-L-alanyl-D-glutamate--2,6-diaminopimelate ligase [Clostridia bacterium]